MAKIISFRAKNASGGDQSFLTDEADKLSFRTGADGAVSLDDVPQNSLPDLLPDLNKDWTNQELADLFRVSQLLASAGVSVDTLRGITDEGDPWFVYCHLNGDVFIHMARIDGCYVLDSPNVVRPLRGQDFNALVSDFTAGALPAKQGEGAQGSAVRRVIKLERGGKVRLHPSAMLAALIWTLYLAAEDLVLLAPDEDRISADDLVDFADVIAGKNIALPATMETADIDGLTEADSFKPAQAADDVHLPGTPEAQAQMRETMTQQSLAMQQNAYAMGLSTIAIAMGFISETVLMDDQRKVLDGLKTLGFTQYGTVQTAATEGTDTVDTAGDPLLAMLAEFLGLDLSLNTETAQAAVDAAQKAALEQELLDASATAYAAEDAGFSLPKTAQAVLRDDKGTEDDVQNATLAQADAASAEALEMLAAMVSPAQETVSLADLLGEQLNMEEFQMGQTTVLASFDVTDSDIFSLASYFGDSGPRRTTDHREFDAQAQAFIDYIQSKDSEVGVITFGNEIIMIDRDAFRIEGADTYTFSWENEEGQVISMIGLRSEFQQFDLIA
ncbi:MAG: hypothetical protein AAF744_13505 [Pseudomonadota bacterium]